MLTRERIQITGVVQGVGFRPFVWKCAMELGLTGWVNNDSAGVTVEIQGDDAAVKAFLNSIETSAPPLAKIDSLNSVRIDPIKESEFAIRESTWLAASSTPISPEISVCADCLDEFQDASNRRYHYPFINCTNCGPRFTITKETPYDRPLTTMMPFPMCDDCQSEYDDPADRRFHAQPNACERCGPQIWFVNDKTNKTLFASHPIPRLATNDATNDATDSAIDRFHLAIAQAKIVAVKGVGGFHLACDALNPTAVRTLRERKGRSDKPFAVMVRDVEQAQSFAVVSDRERQLLQSKERPVVLLRKSNSQSPLATGVSPGNNFIGVMLPYSPLHYLITDANPLVMTSANVSDEPIVRTNEEAQAKLAELGLADHFLLHNREIHIGCDDSVIRCVDDETVPIRRSRGYAPMPVRLRKSGSSILAVGGEIKSTFCVTRDDYAYMSQHIGDMGNIDTLDAMKGGVEHFLRLFRVDVQAVAADLHPGYLSGQWAEQFATTLAVPLFRVQHHFAHVASLIAEKELDDDQKIIACCFDGTGYGPDQTIWGGEFMVANTKSFERCARLAPFPLPGGDACIKRPWRIALSLLKASDIDWQAELPSLSAATEQEVRLLRQQLDKRINCVLTSSMGRLFDAVASLIGVRHEVNYEAQAAMELEALAQTVIDDVDPSAYSFQVEPAPRTQASLSEKGLPEASLPETGLPETPLPETPLPETSLKKPHLTEIRVTGLLSAICQDVLRGDKKEIIAARFHHAVANLIADVCTATRGTTSIDLVGLTGGVFQNVCLLRLAKQRLKGLGFRVLTHSIVPPNDGGIALGQAVVARNRYRG